jgi:hypothetical protein
MLVGSAASHPFFFGLPQRLCSSETARKLGFLRYCQAGNVTLENDRTEGINVLIS